MSYRKRNRSGYYQSESGTPFHAHGNNMSDETISTLGEVADAAVKALKHKCPTCGNAWLHGLEWQQEKGWHCTCGWTGDFEDAPAD